MLLRNNLTEATLGEPFCCGLPSRIPRKLSESFEDFVHLAGKTKRYRWVPEHTTAATVAQA